MARWSLPASPAPRKINMEIFKGNDFTNEPANVKPYRSPYAVNMMRESVGKVRKRPGYSVDKTYPAKINGVHYYWYKESGVLKRKRVVHSGNKLYLDPLTVLYTGCNDALSASRQIGDKLIIFDGLKALSVTDDATPVVTLESIAYTPTILIARKPTGGGITLDPINLIGKRRTERFAGEADTLDYQLSATEIDAATVEVKKLNSSGGFDTLTEETNFTVDRTAGKVTFNTAPGASPVTGEDNVYITYSKTVTGYADRINKCDILTLYGVGGARDRIFAAGNSDYPNQDYYCQQNDPTYFGDLWYSQLGQSDSRIMGYSIINNTLATHKDYSEDRTNVIIRTGTLIDGKAAFTIVNAFQGTGAVSKHAFGILETEPLFLTKEGIFAVTPSDVLGERYAQNRSYFLNGKLLNETSLENAYATVWNQMYVLSVNGNLYILDGLQYSGEQNDPFSRRQYEGYYWTGIAARIIFEEDGKLYFGTSDGNIFAFATDYDDMGSYVDNGITAITAQWLTPEFYGKDFYKNKNFTKIAVLLASAVATGCRIWALYEGIKELLRDYDNTARYFSYEGLSYSKFTYKTDTTPRDMMEKIKIKKVKKVQFLFENDIIRESFGLYGATAEFTEVE